MNNTGTLLEEALTATLEAVDGLAGRVCPVVDIQKSTGPLAIYEQQDETEESVIDGLTGLCSSVFKIHVLHSTYEKMRLLSEQIKRNVLTMRQCTYKSVYVEEVSLKLASPDIYEDKVQLFRRSYQVTIQYQIKED